MDFPLLFMFLVLYKVYYLYDAQTRFKLVPKYLKTRQVKLQIGNDASEIPTKPRRPRQSTSPHHIIV